MSKVPQTLFGKRLREARLKASIPQDKLGVLIGIDEMSSSARISRYETGIHAPPFEIAMRLAQALGVPTAYFYCEEEILAELLLVLSKKSPDKLYELKSQLE